MKHSMWTYTKYVFYSIQKYEIIDFHNKLLKWTSEKSLLPTAWDGSPKWLGNILFHLGYHYYEITKGHIARCKGEITDIDKNIRTIYKDNQEVPYYAFSIETRCLNNTQKPMYQVWCKFIEKFYPASKEMGFSFLFDDPENKICLKFDEANMLEHYNLYPEEIYKIDFSFPDINSNSSSHMNIKSARDLKELLEKLIDTKISLNEIRVPKKIKKLVQEANHKLKQNDRCDYFAVYPVKEITFDELDIEFLKKRRKKGEW